MCCTNLEEEADDENLQSAHANHHGALNETEVDDPALRAADGAEVSVLARAEVLLVPRDGGQLARHLVDGFFEFRGLFRGRPLLGRELRLLFVLDLYNFATRLAGHIHSYVVMLVCGLRGAPTAISKSTNFSE